MNKIIKILLVILISAITTYCIKNDKKYNPVIAEYLETENEIKIWYETFGNKNGRPIIYMHGGPGSGLRDIQNNLNDFFDLKKDYIILFDQRGCGKSLPRGAFTQNTTLNIVEDINKLQKHLSIEKADIWGHSWGSTVALSYAQKYPQNVSKLVVSGVYLARDYDADWIFYQTKRFFPEEYSKMIAVAGGGDNLFERYYKIVNGNDIEKQKSAIATFATVEKLTMNLVLDKKDLASRIVKDEDISGDTIIDYQIFFWYLKNKCFLSEKQFIQNMKKITVPTFILQGRYDLAITPEGAYTLSQLITNSTLVIIENTGHRSKADSYKKELKNIFTTF